MLLKIQRVNWKVQVEEFSQEEEGEDTMREKLRDMEGKLEVPTLENKDPQRNKEKN